jgi:hypothetical protein
MGLFNAAVWVGGSVFFSFLAAPVFFTPEVTAFAPKPANGLVAQAVLGRYFMLHIICGTIASLHLLIEWLYNGGGFPSEPLPSFVCCLASRCSAANSSAQNSLFGISKNIRSN